MTTSQYSPEQAIFWGEFVEVAYQMYLAEPHNTAPQQPSYFPAGWNLVMDLTVAPIDRIFRDTEFIGFIAQSTADPKQYAVVFRGTESDLDWIGDLELWSVPFNDIPNGGRTEAGFTEMYASIRAGPPGDGAGGGTTTALTQLAGMFGTATNITVTGHSLGGALAILYAAVFAHKNAGVPLDCYTFAAPMVGNAQFASAYNELVPNSHRIYNLPDIVPRAPGTELGYAQVQTGIQIDSLTTPGVHWSIACFHSLLVYLYVLGSRKYGLGDCGTSAVTAREAVLPAATPSVIPSRSEAKARDLL